MSNYKSTECLRRKNKVANLVINEDHTYNDIREKSIRQWLKEMSEHPDLAVRGGVKVTLDYIDYLKEEIKLLEEKSKLKDEYLKKMRSLIK